MKMTKTIVISTVLAASAGLSQLAQAESPLTGNIGFTSNYIWRGVTQGADESAISGGIDYAKSGFYVGTWVSSLGGGAQYEQDIYAGYGFKAGPVDLDVGYIMYTYPVGSATLDFDELYLNATYKNFGAGIALTMDKEASTPYEDDMYIYIKADFEVAKGTTLGLLIGDYDFDDPAATDYTHYKVGLSKDDFTFAYEKNDMPGAAGDPRFTVSYSKSFDLM